MTKTLKCLRFKKYLTEDEVERLYRACSVFGRQQERNRLMIKMMYVFGLRVSELCGMLWSHIDLKASTVFIQRLKNGKSIEQPIYTRDLHRDIVTHKRRCKDVGINSVYVFLSEQDSAISRKTVDAIINKAGIAAGFEYRVHAHMLRHGCGYYLANKGVSTKIIQSVLGHRDPRNTDIYTEISPRTLELLRR